jgi:hypothetical protein
MAETTHEVIREAVDALIRLQAQHLYERGMLSVAEKLYPPAPGSKVPASRFELVLGKLEAQAIVQCFTGKLAEDIVLSPTTYLGYPVVIEGETGVKARPKTEGVTMIRYRPGSAPRPGPGWGLTVDDLRGRD